jgi:hypothetical protein
MLLRLQKEELMATTRTPGITVDTDGSVPSTKSTVANVYSRAWAGVSEEDRAAPLGHATRTMPEHYASADVGLLISLANRVLDRVGTMTILRVANG